MKRILQNSFGKAILCLLVALMSGGTAWAADELCYTLEPTAVSGGNTNYNGSGDATIGGIQWNVQGVINTNPWRIGGQYLRPAERSISSKTPLDKIINEVKLTLGNIEDGWGSFTVNSLTLTVASDANFTNVVDTKQITSVGAGSSPTFTGNWPAGSYYRFTFNITTGGVLGFETSDKYIEFSKVEFKGPYVETPVISGTQVFGESTQVTITCPAPDADATIQYTLDGGVNWHDYSAPFTLSQTTTVIAKATKAGKNESHEATKTFCQEGDLVEVDWDLTKAPTGSSSNNQVTWTNFESGEYYVDMTLARNGIGNTRANSHLGGTYGDTRFYQNHRLTITPHPGYEIAHVDFICMANNYTGGLNGTWTNATASVSGNKVTVTPTDLTAAISTTISAETSVIAVNVYYIPRDLVPYIAMKDIPIEVTSAAVANGTIDVYYNDVNQANAQVQVVDGNNQAVTWVHPTLTSNNAVVSYSIDANTSTESRTAYIIVKSGNYSSNRITVTQEAAIVLYNSQENTSTITNNDGKTCCVILDGRTFSTGKWYTLCLPFDVTIANSPLAGADARELSDETNIDGKTLKLEFTSVNELEAGTPYIIRWESGSNIVNPVFENVTISKATPEVVCDLGNSRGIQFVGTYDPKTYDEVDQSKLFISNNTFYYVGVNTTIGAQRAYFQLIGFIYDTGAASTGGVKEFGITLLDEDPTGIEDVNDNLNLNDEPIYNIAGQRIQKMQRGINIVNGKKIFVK